MQTKPRKKIANGRRKGRGGGELTVNAGRRIVLNTKINVLINPKAEVPRGAKDALLELVSEERTGGV